MYGRVVNHAKEQGLNNARVYSVRLGALLESLRAQGVAAPLTEVSPSHEIVRGFLFWEAPLTRAEQAYQRIADRVVDLNELRVCLVEEVVAMIGERYPRATQRVSRLRRVLADLFAREIGVSIDHLREAPAVDAAEYLLSLDGMLPYVANFVRLHALNHHVLPIDKPLFQALARSEIVDPLTAPDEIGEWIVDQIEPDECLEVHLRLVRWAETGFEANELS